MRKSALQAQPRLSGEIMRTADPTLRPLLKQIEEMHGVAAVVQTHDGGQMPVRINRSGGVQVIEAFTEGTWQGLSGSSVSTEVTKVVSAASTGESGAAGKDGSVWRDGSGVPSHALGVDGDYYLDDAAGDVYLRASGMYSVVANVKGVDGAKGDKGDKGEVGETGAQGAQGVKGDTGAGVDVLTALGDMLYEDAASAPARLPGNTAATRKVLTQTGTGSVSGVPSWETLRVADLWANRALNPQWLLEETFEKLLQGTLSTGNATPASVTRTFGNAATDNNGIATWSGSGWSSSTGFRSTSINADYMETTIRTDGTHDIVLYRGATSGGAQTSVAVLLDGVTQTAWNQAASQTYTLSSVVAGVHTIRLTNGSGGYVMRLASIQYYQLPYQGVGVPGDVVQILYVPSWFVCTAASTGATNNGGYINAGGMGEAVIPRFPLGTIYTDKDFTRANVQPSGCVTIGANGIWKTSSLGSWGASSSSAQPAMRSGISCTLSSTLGTRGFQYQSDIACFTYAQSYASSILALSILPMLGVVTSTGSGTSLNIGDIVLFIGTYHRASVADATCAFGTSASGNASFAADIFKLS